MYELFLVTVVSYQVPARRVNLAACNACICCVEAYFLCLLHYIIHFLHLFGCRAKDKCPRCISNVTSMPESKVDDYHITIAEFSVCNFSMRQSTIWPGCYDQWIQRRLVGWRICTHFHCLVD